MPPLINPANADMIRDIPCPFMSIAQVAALQPMKDPTTGQEVLGVQTAFAEACCRRTCGRFVPLPNLLNGGMCADKLAGMLAAKQLGLA